MNKEKTQNQTFTLKPSTIEAIKAQAELEGLSASRITERLVRHQLIENQLNDTINDKDIFDELLSDLEEIKIKVRQAQNLSFAIQKAKLK